MFYMIFHCLFIIKFIFLTPIREYFYVVTLIIASSYIFGFIVLGPKRITLKMETSCVIEFGMTTRIPCLYMRGIILTFKIT